MFYTFNDTCMLSTPQYVSMIEQLYSGNIKNIRKILCTQTFMTKSYLKYFLNALYLKLDKTENY